MADPEKILQHSTVALVEMVGGVITMKHQGYELNNS